MNNYNEPLISMARDDGGAPPLTKLAGIIRAATQQWEVPINIAESEDIAHEIETRGSFVQKRAEGRYPSYPNNKVRDMVEALDAGRQPAA